MPRKDPKEEAKPTKKNVKEEFDDYFNEEGTGDSMSPSPAPTKSFPKKAKNGRARAVRDRPKKRSLIRWNETYDQRTLLAVQHVMSKKGMKIPWDEIGAELGPTITEGAIVQHLAKLRTRLESEGVKVTPPMKRGGRAASNIPAAKLGNNNKTKTVSAKGGVAKRTGNAKAQKKDKSVDEEADYDDVAMEDDPPASRKAKADEVKKELGVGKGKGKSRYVDVKSERGSENEDLKFLGTCDSADTHQHDEYMSDRSSDDGHYQLEDDDGDEHQAVAVGAPFLALETSDKSSVASSSYSDTSVPSKLVVLPIGRNLARNLKYHDGNVHSGYTQDHGTYNVDHGGNMTPSPNMSGRGSKGSQGEGGFIAKNGYSGDANAAFEHDTVRSSVSGTPSGFIKREQTTPPIQSKFAGYGMQTGPFERVSQPGRLDTPMATANNFQYSSANTHRGSYANTGFNSPNTTNGNHNSNGYGFPISTERHIPRQATILSNERGYLNPPGGQLQQSGFINSASTPANGTVSYNFDEGAINSSMVSTQRGQIPNGSTNHGYAHQQSRDTPQTSAQSIASGGAPYESSHGFHFVDHGGDNDPYEDVDIDFDLNDNPMWSYFDDQPASGFKRGF